MFALVLTALLATSQSAPLDDLPIIDQSLVDEVNSHNRWKADLSEQFRNTTIREARRLCGAFLQAEPSEDVMPKPLSDDPIPAAFDARQKWPKSIHPIRNQAQCGSCWAFAASESLSDRFAIQSNNSVEIVLSPQDLVSCDDRDGDEGCMGGFPIRAWKYMKSTGIVADSCYPYSSGGDDKTGQCLLTGSQDCPSGNGQVKLYKAASAYSVGSTSDIEAIQREIMTHGPVEAAFQVYQDFYAYRKGVYEHLSGSLVGGHAVKVVGWGTQDGVDFWLVANSWGSSWADLSGYFMIRRGTDECQFESQMVAGLADLNDVYVD